MKLKSVDRVADGRFITRYNLEYELNNGDKKTYEMISRNKNLNVDNVNTSKTDAVVMILFNEDKTKILLNKEFRLAINSFIYNFPAGLVEKNETIENAAKRELKEETGLDLVSIEKVFKDSYSSIGISNDKNTTLIGTCKGEIKESIFADEEIIARFYTKEEARKIVENEDCSSRTQSFLYLWSIEK